MGLWQNIGNWRKYGMTGGSFPWTASALFYTQNAVFSRNYRMRFFEDSFEAEGGKQVSHELVARAGMSNYKVFPNISDQFFALVKEQKHLTLFQNDYGDVYPLTFNDDGKLKVLVPMELPIMEQVVTDAGEPVFDSVSIPIVDAEGRALTGLDGKQAFNTVSKPRLRVKMTPLLDKSGNAVLNSDGKQIMAPATKFQWGEYLLLDTNSATDANGKKIRLRSAELKKTYDHLEWYSRRLRYNNTRYNVIDALTKYLPLISVVMAGVVIAILLYVGGQQYAGAFGQNSPMITQFLPSMNALTAEVGRLAPVVVHNATVAGAPPA